MVYCGSNGLTNAKGRSEFTDINNSNTTTFVGGRPLSRPRSISPETGTKNTLSLRIGKALR